MRLYSIHPKYLDQKGLCGLWAESLLAQSCLIKGESKSCYHCNGGKFIDEEGICGTCKGTGKIKTPYYNHPQLLRFKQTDNPIKYIGLYLIEIWNEAHKRGYNFDKKKIKYEKKLPKLKLHDKIYIDGLFDGEGCITLFKRKNLQKGRKTPSYFLSANIRMTNFKIMNWLNKVYNGTYGKAYNVPKNKNWKPNKEWKVEGSRCVDFLKQIYPYLKIKNKQSEIAFKFGKTINRHSGASKTPKKILKYRDKLCKDMKKLNKRGIK